MRLCKFLTIFIVFFCVLACSDSNGGSSNSGPLNGSGTGSDPYQITNEDDLKSIADNLNAVYILMADITLTGEWTPIGTYPAPFSGKLYGNGHKITGLNIDSDGVLSGVFGAINKGYVNKLIIEHKTVRSSNKYGYVGALAGWMADSAIDNVSIRPVNPQTDEISCTGEKCLAGGLVADIQNSAVSNVYTTGKINSGFFAGGIVGLVINSSVISSSYAAGEITAGRRAGGVANYVVNGSTIENSAYAGASITGTDTGRIVYDYNTSNENVLSNNFASSALSGTWKNDKDSTDGMAASPDDFKNPQWYNANTLPWLSSGAWKIDPAKNGSLPILSWE